MLLVVASPLILAVYAYLVYPALIAGLAWRRTRRRRESAESHYRPAVSVSLVCFNEERHIEASLENLLASTYDGPVQVVVVSDASTDATDSIVSRFAERGVQLVVAPSRAGKTAAENYGSQFLKGDIIVHVDATSHPVPDAISHLVGAMSDPTVGVASGNDVSVPSLSADATEVLSWSESSYVDFEMRLRSWESQVRSIVGASGCFYAVRRALFEATLHPADCRDFASVLDAYAAGLRSVSVPKALCQVPRATSREADFRRKLRTMSGGLITLGRRSAMLNPFRYGVFSWLLFSHKLCRWLVYPAMALALVTAAVFRPYAVGLIVVACMVAYGCLRIASRVGHLAAFASPGRRIFEFGVVSSIAGVLAWPNLLVPRRVAYWEPTRR